MEQQIEPGVLVVSRMGLLHRVTQISGLRRTVTLEDGRTFDALEFVAYNPEHHGPIATLETCADCHVDGAA